MNKFVGVNNDGNDAIIQYPWGQVNHLKKMCNPAMSRTRFMTTEVMSGIWSNALTILLLLAKHTGWTLDICFPSLLTNTISVKLSFMTIVVQIHTVLMGDIALLQCVLLWAIKMLCFYKYSAWIGSWHLWCQWECMHGFLLWATTFHVIWVFWSLLLRYNDCL